MAATPLISQKAALSLLLEQCFDWGTESIPFALAGGRVVRQPIFPDRPQPPFDRVMMDGIAIHYPSYAKGQRFFRIDGLQAAGDSPKKLIKLDYCREIMTGAALPEGASTVIPYEVLKASNDGFLLEEGVQDGKNIHRKGSDLDPDLSLGSGHLTDPSAKPLVEAGRLIHIGLIGMLASFGYTRVVVSRLPKCVIISTGDELVEINEKPLDYQIRRSNVYQIAYLLQSLGIQASLPHLPDDPAVMKQQLKKLLAENDLVILSGGVSKGKKDYVPILLQEQGIRSLFHGVAQRPGKPLWAGRDEDTMVFGLPGNPISSLLSALAYVLPFIRKNIQQNERTTFAVLGQDHDFSPPLTQFLAVRLESQANNGQLVASPVKQQGSGDGSSLLHTDGFLILPADRANFRKGEVFPYLSLE